MCFDVPNETQVVGLREGIRDETSFCEPGHRRYQRTSLGVYE